jgi:hypothetical protein
VSLDVEAGKSSFGNALVWLPIFPREWCDFLIICIRNFSKFPLALLHRHPIHYPIHSFIITFIRYNMPKAPVSTSPDMRTGAEKHHDTLANKKSQEQAELRQASSSEKVPRAAKVAALKNAGLSTSKFLKIISHFIYYLLQAGVVLHRLVPTSAQPLLLYNLRHQMQRKREV